MNTIHTCLVEYITSSRSIEIVSLKNSDRRFYIYNFEGNHFRVFTEILGLIRFFESGVEPKQSFFSDDELDEFILNYDCYKAFSTSQ